MTWNASVKRMGEMEQPILFSYPFLQLMPTGGDFLACVADMGVLEEEDAFYDLDVGWNVEEIKREGYQLVGNRPVGICEV